MNLRFLTGLLLIVCVSCGYNQFQAKRQGFNRDAKLTYKSEKKQIGKTYTGEASYYGPGFHGKKTANGETYDQNAMTCAHKTLPFNTKLKVTNLSNNKSAIVRVNDRGPFKKGRIVDLSVAAAKKIDLIKQGVAKVKVEVIK